MMAMQPTQSPFIWGQGGVAMTPEDVAKLREMAALSLDRSADTSPVGHWSAGLSRVVDALGGVMKERKADRAEAEGRASADTFVQQSPVLSAMLGGQSGALPAAMPQGGMPSGDTAAAVRAGLIQRGMPEHVADGFVMNFQDESGLNPGINEAAPIVPGSRGGFGLAQWTGPRRVALEKFAEARGVPASDLDAQLDFLMTELQGPESGAASAIFTAPDAGSAAAAVASEFLRPAPEHLNRRVAKYTGGQYQSGQAPGDVIAALSGAAANPWVQKQYGPAIEALMGQQSAMQGAQYEAQLKQQDPAYQIALQQAQLELEQTRNPPPAKPLEVGGVLLDPTTYEPIFDSRQPDPGFTIISPQEVSQLGLPAGAYQRGSDGKITQIGGGGVTVNMGGGKFDEEFAKQDATALATVGEQGMAAQQNIGQIDRLSTLMSQGPSGFEAGLKTWLGDRGVKTEGLDVLQAADALISAMVPAQRQPGSGPMSDRDIELFRKSLPRLINTPEGNAKIIQTLRGIAEYDMQRGQIVQMLRQGEMTRAEAFNALQGLPNPLSGISDGGSTGTPTPETAPAPKVRQWTPQGGLK